MPISIMQWRVEIGIFFGRLKLDTETEYVHTKICISLKLKISFCFVFFYNANFTLVTLNQIQSLEDVILAIVSGYTIEI